MRHLSPLRLQHLPSTRYKDTNNNTATRHNYNKGLHHSSSNRVTLSRVALIRQSTVTNSHHSHHSHHSHKSSNNHNCISNSRMFQAFPLIGKVNSNSRSHNSRRWGD